MAVEPVAGDDVSGFRLKSSFLMGGLKDADKISFTDLRGKDCSMTLTSSISARALKSGPVSRAIVIFSAGRCTTGWMGILQQGISGLCNVALGHGDFGVGVGVSGAAPKTSGGRDLECNPTRPLREVVSMLGTLKMLKDRCACILSLVDSFLVMQRSKEPCIS